MDRPAVLSAVIFWMTIMPWLVRNYEVFGKPVFIRDNFGVELRIGNNPLAEGIYVLAYHPADSVNQYAKYKRMGEAAFCAEQGSLAREWIAQNPGRFLVLTFRRFIFFWDGMPRVSDVEGLIAAKNLLFLATSVLAIWGLLLAWKRRIHGVFLFAALLIFYPAGLLCMLPRAALPASHRSGASDPWSLSGL